MDRNTRKKLAIIEAAVVVRKRPDNPFADNPTFQAITYGMEWVVWMLKTDDGGFSPDVFDYPLVFDLEEKDNNKAP